MTTRSLVIDGCLSAGKCANCYRSHNRSVPLLSGIAACVECGDKSGEALTVHVCDASREQWERNEACRTCRAVTAAKGAS